MACFARRGQTRIGQSYPAFALFGQWFRASSMRTTVFPRFFSLSASLPAWRSMPVVVRVLGALALGGCSSFNEPASVKGFIAFIAPYKPDVIQGNVVTTEQIALIKPGMSRAQVREILGSPLITDPFHGDRWDYVFTLRAPGLRRPGTARSSCCSRRTRCRRSTRPRCPTRGRVRRLDQPQEAAHQHAQARADRRRARGAARAAAGRRGTRGVRGRAGRRHAHLPAAGIPRRRELAGAGEPRGAAAHRHRRRLRAHGPHADRSGARRARLRAGGRARRARQPATRARTPAPSSAAPRASPSPTTWTPCSPQARC